MRVRTARRSATLAVMALVCSLTLKATNSARTAGFLVDADAKELVSAAAQSDIGR